MKAEDQSAEREALLLVEEYLDRRVRDTGGYGETVVLPAVRAALSAREAPARKPFAWFTVDDITDRDGTPIGRDEPRFSWGEEPPEELGWTPLYLDPAPPAAKAVEMDARDAARYRWLRKQTYKDEGTLHCQGPLGSYDNFAGGLLCEMLDAAIDAALSKQGGNHG